MGLPAQRLVGWLSKSWWREPPEAARYRWRRFMMHAPVAGLVGIIFGILAGGRWDISLVWAPPLCGSLGVYAVYLATRVESFARSHAGSTAGRSAGTIALVSDVFLGGFLGQAIAIALGKDSAALFSGGAATLVAYNYFVTRFFWGDWVTDLVHAMSGQGRADREREYEFPRRLVAQGHIDEAVQAYEKISHDKGGETGPFVLAAQLLVEQDRPAEAIEWYRKALAAPRADARRSSIFVEKIVELAVGNLNDPDIAREDLEALITRFPTAEEVGWASTMLAALPTAAGVDRWLSTGKDDDDDDDDEEEEEEEEE